MTESLADQWVRACALAASSPDFPGAHAAVLFSLLDASLQRYVLDAERFTEELRTFETASPEKKAIVRAASTYAAVTARWITSDMQNAYAALAGNGAHMELQRIDGVQGDALANIGLATTGPNTSRRGHAVEACERATATWAAGAIVRRRVDVPTLEAAPTLQQLADWMEAFSKALTLALTRVEMVRVPSLVAGAMVGARTAATDSATRSHGVRDRTGRTFSSADLAHWRLTPPRDHQLALHLPFESIANAPRPSDVRDVLDGRLQRAYVATWALVDRYAETHGGDNQLGIFERDRRHVLLDLYGLKPAHTTVRGKRYERPASGAEADFDEDLERLTRIGLEGIGDVRSETQPLVERYTDGLAGGREVFHHAHLALVAVRENFIQVPQAVMRLKADDTPLALGIARVLRRKARDVLRGTGRYETKLQQLADAAGEDVAQQTRDRGARAYWANLTERMARVIQAGELGSLHVKGEGPSACVTLTPSVPLATVYASLAEDRPAPTLGAELEKLLAQPRRTGRPLAPLKGKSKRR